MEHLQNVTTNDYDSITELHTPKITVTTVHRKSSVFPSRYLAMASNGGRSHFLWVSERSPASGTSF
jgi:hypothetical protein